MLLTLILSASLLLTVSSVTVEQENYVRGVCRDVLAINDDFIAGFVRLSFHDCVSKCDGAINIDNADNAGLNRYIRELETAFTDNDVYDIMSRADFWALCGTEAVLKGWELSNTDDPAPVIRMRYGRVDANVDIPYTTDVHSFPNAHHGLDPILNYFSQNFGLTTRETVALLGAHTLGRARLIASGFQGPWVRNVNSLDNAYYIDMLQTVFNWSMINVGDAETSKYQWTRAAFGNTRMMLNSDMCLAFDIQPDENGFVSTTLSNTALSPTHSIVLEFSQDNAGWLTEFGDVFTKMIDNVDAELSSAGASTEAMVAERAMREEQPPPLPSGEASSPPPPEEQPPRPPPSTTPPPAERREMLSKVIEMLKKGSLPPPPPPPPEEDSSPSPPEEQPPRFPPSTTPPPAERREMLSKVIEMLKKENLPPPPPPPSDSSPPPPEEQPPRPPPSTTPPPAERRELWSQVIEMLKKENRPPPPPGEQPPRPPPSTTPPPAERREFWSQVIELLRRENYLSSPPSPPRTESPPPRPPPQNPAENDMDEQIVQLLEDLM